MKMKSGVEQAICILIMLATQIDRRPIKSAILSRRLSVSDSYLKKVMRSLVVSGLVDSESGKDGGFRLNRMPEEITMLHIYEAIEGTHSFVRPTNLAEKVFLRADKIKNKRRKSSQYSSMQSSNSKPACRNTHLIPSWSKDRTGSKT